MAKKEYILKPPPAGLLPFNLETAKNAAKLTDQFGQQVTLVDTSFNHKGVSECIAVISKNHLLGDTVHICNHEGVEIDDSTLLNKYQIFIAPEEIENYVLSYQENPYSNFTTIHCDNEKELAKELKKATALKRINIITTKLNSNPDKRDLPF